MRALAFAVAVVLADPALHAQTPPTAAQQGEARVLFERGVASYAEGAYPAAMADFERAYELSRNANLLYNLSVTHEALGRYAEALSAMREYQSRASGASRRAAEVAAGLERLAGLVGTLVVAVDIPGLVVRVDGIERPTDEARRGVTVSAGARRVALSAPGYETREFERTVTGRETVTLRETLPRVRSSIAVECPTPDAEVLVDGAVQGRTPLASPLSVDEGRHRVELRRPGYTPYSTEVEARGTGARVEARLQWADPIPEGLSARVYVRPSEPGANVFVEGRALALDGSTPVPAGPHVLRVSRASFLTAEVPVTLAAGETRTVDVWLDPTPAYRDAWVSGVQRRRRVAMGVLIAGGVLTVAGGVALGLTLPGYLEAREAFTAAQEFELTCTRVPIPPGCQGRNVVQERLDAGDEANSRVLGVALGASVAGVGLGALVTGAVLLSGAGDARRFERPTPLRVSFGPNVLSVGGVF